MNIILVLIDSVNRNALSPYGCKEFATPNMQAFVDRGAWRFDNHFTGSLPCMPARREIFSGTMNLQWRPWGPLEPFDLRLPQLLEKAGYSTGMVTDHYHYWEESANGYIQGFQSAELVRGHELDFWKPLLPDTALPQWVHNVEKWRPGYGHRYYSNIAQFKDEKDYFSAKVMNGACDWLKAPKQNNPFFLQVECFDVHEPFDVPEPYASMYGQGTDRDKYTLWPPYQNAAAQEQFLAGTSQEELSYIRSQYGGKITMADHWFGRLMQTMDELDLWDDTIVIVTTDHGHDLGERHGFGKQYPHFDSHANIPLLVWDPRHKSNGRAVTELTSTLDIFGTILDAGGVALPPGTHSGSVLPLMANEEARGREALLYGIFGNGLCCTDGDWTLVQPPDRSKPLFAYSSMVPTTIIAPDKPVDQGYFMPGVDIPQWKIPFTQDRPTDRRPLDSEPLLFNRAVDPGQVRNLVDERPEELARMRRLMRDTLADCGAPVELFDRLGLSALS